MKKPSPKGFMKKIEASAADKKSDAKAGIKEGSAADLKKDAAFVKKMLPKGKK